MSALRPAPKVVIQSHPNEGTLAGSNLANSTPPMPRQAASRCAAELSQAELSSREFKPLVVW
jgi:hypothetical protein